MLCSYVSLISDWLLVHICKQPSDLPSVLNDKIKGQLILSVLNKIQSNILFGTLGLICNFFLVYILKKNGQSENLIKTCW